MTGRRRSALAAGIPLAALLLGAAVLWLLATVADRDFAERLRRTAELETRAECTRLLGAPMYDCPTDDEAGAATIERICRGQHRFPALEGGSVAFYRPGGKFVIPAKAIFVLYDRRTDRIVRSGSVRL